MTTGAVWWGLSLLTGLGAAFLVAYVILDALFGRTPIQRRLKALKVFTVGERKDELSATRQILHNAGETVGSLEVLSQYAARSEPLLDQLTGAPRPTEWLAIRMGSSVATMLVLGVLLPAWIGLPVGLGLGFALPPMLLKHRINRRRQRFADELPGMLSLMLSSLRSGFTLQQSVEAAVRDDEGPVAEELRRALSESRISGEFEDALARVGERVRSQEMVWLVMALRLQREVGGSLAEVMQTTADTMRERAYLRRHVRALSAEGRMSAYILMALPVAIAVMLSVTRPDYVRPLYTELAGIMLSLFAVGLLVVGTIWLRAVTRIEV